MLKRLSNIPRAYRIAVTALVVIAFAAVGGAWAYDTSQKDKISDGVSVGGVELGGQDSDQAHAAIQEQVVKPLMKPVDVRFEGHSYALTPRQVGMRADVDGMVDEALEASRSGGILHRLVRYAGGGGSSGQVKARVYYSQARLTAAVKRIAAKIDRPATDATVTPSADSIEPTPGKAGVAADRNALRADVAVALRSAAGPRTVKAAVHKTEPEVTTKELASKYPTFLTVDRSTFKLRLYKDLKLAKTYTVAVGQAGLETPAGLYDINDKQVNPSWHVPDSPWAGSMAGMVIPPGPEDPLKARWMGFYDGAGIHGTDEPESVGSAASHGCIRMRVPDVIDLYPRVPVGTPIYIG